MRSQMNAHTLYSSLLSRQRELNELQFATEQEVMRLFAEVEQTKAEFHKELRHFVTERIRYLCAVGESVLNKCCVRGDIPEILDSLVKHQGLDFRWVLGCTVEHIDESQIFLSTDHHSAMGLTPLPRCYLHMSDREFAKEIRLALRAFKLSRANDPTIVIEWEGWKRQRRIRELERSIEVLTQPNPIIEVPSFRAISR